MVQRHSVAMLLMKYQAQGSKPDIDLSRDFWTLKPRPHYAEWSRAIGSIDTVEQVWTYRSALLSHAGPNRTQPETSRYVSKEVDATSVVWTC